MECKKTFKTYISLGLLVIMTGGLLACSKKTGDATPAITTTGTDPGDDELTRRCRVPVQYTDSTAHIAALEDLVQSVVQKKETPTTMCVAALSTPLNGFDASLRFEYEDDLGLRWVTFRKNSLVYSTQQSNKLRLIYLDIYGYVQLDTTINSNGNYAGSVKMADVSASTSYLDQINDYLKQIEDTCNASPAKCLNPIFIVDPTTAAPPTTAQIIQQANEALAGLHGATPYTLGNVEFSSSMVERTLF